MFHVLKMSVEVRKKEKESTAAFLRRFTRRIQQSGIMLEARKSRFYTPPETRRQKRLRALHRLMRQKEIERLKKLGKI